MSKVLLERLSFSTVKMQLVLTLGQPTRKANILQEGYLPNDDKEVASLPELSESADKRRTGMVTL